MQIEEICRLISTVSESNLTSFQYEEGNIRIAMTAGNMPPMPPAHMPVGMPPERFPVSGNGQESQSCPKAPAVQIDKEISVKESKVMTETQETAGKVITSPLVGVFYAAPSEEAAPFVQVGDHVQKGQTVAIVEAMKLMNEIESECTGTIKEIFVKNGQSVEYGQPLFRVEA